VFCSGLADEAAPSIDRQIEAHQVLGWTHIELRLVRGINVVGLPDEAFEQIARKVEAAGLRVDCLSSEIANWARPISGDFSRDVADLKRAIPRMRRLGTRYIRIMSYPNDGWPESQWKREVIRRLRKLTQIAEDAGIVLLHENCAGWGGLRWQNTLELLEAMDSPAFRLLFDTGNPVAEGLDSWEFYQAIREHIVHVHIKDARREDSKVQFTFPGEGEGRLRAILGDLRSRGYQGALSIEPHLAQIVSGGAPTHSRSQLARLHPGQPGGQGSGPARASSSPRGDVQPRSSAAFELYLEYGRRLMEMLREMGVTPLEVPGTC